ncbi:Regulator of drug sensitivity 2 [Smittium culicis]|uniref:Regulator of drug sensitivity 2 n=1 Tax=Smittium culicis TaxID=133412 RepID=A0A1R1XQ00_9FUNG|nr:Regulator of drug sensitivity 2 [Smittium culicis]OMJ25179.1 Regulator of drug sensitivity 2 [Smittium culicis]
MAEHTDHQPNLVDSISFEDSDFSLDNHLPANNSEANLINNPGTENNSDKSNSAEISAPKIKKKRKKVQKVAKNDTNVVSSTSSANNIESSLNNSQHQPGPLSSSNSTFNHEASSIFPSSNSFSDKNSPATMHLNPLSAVESIPIKLTNPSRTNTNNSLSFSTTLDSNINIRKLDQNPKFNEFNDYNLSNPQDILRGNFTDHRPKLGALSPLPPLSTKMANRAANKKIGFPLGTDSISTSLNFGSKFHESGSNNFSVNKNRKYSRLPIDSNSQNISSVEQKKQMLEPYYLSVLNLEDSSSEEKLRQILSSKFTTGVLKPFNYVNGYLRMHRFMEKNMSSASVTRLVGILSIYRSTFMSIIKSLTDADVLVSEVAFEKLLFDYDHTFHTFGVPACLWRRTGEIFKANKQFADMVGLPIQYFREGRVTIYELMTEESTVNYLEKYTNVAFDVTQKAVLTSCVLQVSNLVRAMVDRDINNGSWGSGSELELEPLPVSLGDRGDPESFLSSLKESDAFHSISKNAKDWDSITKKMYKEITSVNKTKNSSDMFEETSFLDRSGNSFRSASIPLNGNSQNHNNTYSVSGQSESIDSGKNQQQIGVGSNNVSNNIYNSSNNDNTSSTLKNFNKSQNSHQESQDNNVNNAAKKKFSIPNKKLPCCFSITIRRDRNCLPIAIIGNFMPIN